MFYPSRFILAAMVLSLLGLSSCEKEHQTIYEEPITSLFLLLTHEDGGTSTMMSYLDRDGVGGQPPIITESALRPNTVYSAELLLQQSNPNASPRLSHLIDTTTVMGQPELHQVFYTAKNGLELEVEYTDMDSNGYPVGFQTLITTSSASEGRLQLIIIHSPNKSGQNVVLGEIDHAEGQIDLEISFNIVIRDGL